MSSLLVIQKYDTVFMGSDTAISTTMKDTIYRLNEKGKKLYSFNNNQLIFCSGDMDAAYKIIDIYSGSDIKTKENLQYIASLYCNNKTTIEIVMAEINKKENRIDVFQISSYNNFEIIEKKIKKGDLGLFAGGIKVEECFNNAYENIKSGQNVLEVYQNTFDEISFEGVGGNLEIYQINLNGVQKIYQNKIKEKKVKYITEIFNQHLIVGQNIYGKVIGSEELIITNKAGSFTVNENQMVAHNMKLSLDTDNGHGKIYIDPEVGIKIQNNKNGSFQDVLYMDIDGDLTMDGRLKITDNGIKLFDIYKNNNGGSLQLNDVSGNLNVKIASENGTSDNNGGTVILYNDSSNKPRVELGISKSYDSGTINLKDNSGVIRAVLYADGNLGSVVAIRDASGTTKSYLAATEGKINGLSIATESYVRSYVADYVASHMPSSPSTS